MAAKSNIKKIKNLQSIILRTILDAQWYITMRRKENKKNPRNTNHQRGNTKSAQGYINTKSKITGTPWQKIVLPTT